MKNGQNTFVAFLELLKVKHTEDFSNRYFNEHPHKYNLLGLSKMLSFYGIANAGTRITDKEKDLPNIECPFVAHLSGGFSAVNNVEPDKVNYLWNGKKITIPVEQFIKAWSGVILLAETTPDSIEPDYQEHRKKELFDIAQKALLIVAGILLFGIAYYSVYHGIAGFRSATPAMTTNIQLFGYSIILLLNLLGVYIGYLLVLKQMHIHSQYADKLCTLFSKSDCNNVLESDAAKLWDAFGWSEIGLGYFSANVVLLLFLPQTVYIIAIINIFTLPYAFWSVWYQKVKAKQWCPLCLIVQVVLWSIFILNVVFGFIRFPEINLIFLKDLLFVSCVYFIAIFTFNLIIPNLSSEGEIEQVKQEINSMKADEEVFRTLLTQQPQYEASHADSQILFGNPDADLQITIFTNPFCNPCAKMHKRVMKALKDAKENICVQYIFSSFAPDLDFANKYLIAAYLEKEKSEFEQIISDWFEKGKPLKEAFFTDLHLDMANLAIETVFQKHEAWKEKTQLRATPTIIVNGYQLPNHYKIEDLRYFTGIVISRSFSNEASLRA